MEELGGGGRSRQHRNAPPSDRLLGVFSHQPGAPALELSEQDIFNTPSGSSPPSPTHSGSSPNRTRGVHNHTRNQYGILAALNDNLKTRSGSDNRPVFNHKASAPVSLSSSSSSTSPAASSSSRMMIPRKPPPPPPVERMRLRHQSAPVNVPVIPAAMRRRARDLEEVLSEEEEEGEEAARSNGVMLPPHEVVAARNSPMLANSVLEGAGRTLKGRDLRQVRNAIWRKTGFLD
ncbi:protein S40-7-like [Salvia miltiorrhiza]|uniref:protein S40-7-like n=1 Tax=Salvia miltiorrhiza TaxID=226208 RepID=UPI0025ACBC54|nr:protein S40-7-like [Salvia miltiorrhiza]